MKKIFTIVAALFITLSVWAQAPEKMSYQAVVRNATNDLVTTQAVGMKISILQGGTTGTVVYEETQIPTTNTNGLVSLEIGTGITVSGDFTTINWAEDTHFIKTETDPTGGTTYTITATSQLMSVPYSFYAKTAGNGITPAQAGEITANTNKIGTISHSSQPLGATNAALFSSSIGRSANEAFAQVIVPSGGTLKNLVVSLQSGGISDLLTLSVRVNGVNTNLNVTFEPGDSIGTIRSNTASTVTINQGDLICLGSPITTSTLYFTATFEQEIN